MEKLQIETLHPFLIPALIFLVSVIFGIIFEKIIIKKLIAIARKTTWAGDDIVIESFKGISFYLILLTGAYFAVYNLFINEKIEERVEKGIVVLIIFLLTVVASRIAVRLVKFYTGKASGDYPSTSIFINLTKAAVFIIGVLFILQNLGISITPAITALGVGGLAVALALQDTLANLFAGLNIIAAKRMRPGDFIRLESGEEGHIEDISWRSTVIRELTNNNIIIPNTKLASAIIKNYYGPDKEMAILINVGVSYDSDLEHVERVTLEVAKEIIFEFPGAVKDFEPIIRFQTFAESSINFLVILRTIEITERGPLISNFIKRLHKRYKQENIEIPFPQRTLHIKESKTEGKTLN